MPKRNVVLLLERGRELCEPRTWYQLGKITGIAHTTISRCRRRGGTLGDVNALKLGDFIGIDGQTMMAYMAEDRAHEPEIKEFWRARLPRLLPSIAIGTALLLAGKGNLIDGYGELTSNITTLPVIHYAK
jgi:hypothetical protein